MLEVLINALLIYAVIGLLASTLFIISSFLTELTIKQKILTALYGFTLWPIPLYKAAREWLYTRKYK